MSAFSDAVLALSPNSYWRFTGASPLVDSGSAGITLTTSGTPVRAPSLVPGEAAAANNAYDLDGGANNFFQAGDNYDLNTAWGSVKFTLLMLFNTDSFAAANRLLEKRVQSGNTEGWYFHLTAGGSDNLTFVMRYADATEDAQTYNTTLVAGTAYMVAVTLDSAIPEQKLYINDGLIGTRSSFQNKTLPNTAVNLFIGADGSGTSRFAGVVDEVAIWSTVALNQTQITTLWAAANTAEAAGQPRGVMTSRGTSW